MAWDRKTQNADQRPAGRLRRLWSLLSPVTCRPGGCDRDQAYCAPGCTRPLPSAQAPFSLLLEKHIVWPHASSASVLYVYDLGTTGLSRRLLLSSDHQTQYLLIRTEAQLISRGSRCPSPADRTPEPLLSTTETALISSALAVRCSWS